MPRALILSVALLIGLAAGAWADVVTTFENQGLAPGTKLDDAGPGGHFLIDGHGFNNTYDTEFGTWSGWALSSMTDATTPGFGNQYSAIAGSGAGGSHTYAVGFPFAFPAADILHPADSWIDLAGGTKAVSIDVTNTTYAFLSMRDGDGFARAFGPGDYLLLDIRGYDALGGTGSVVGEVDFYLANFLNSHSDLLAGWQTVDLAPLASAKSLRFGLRSSDTSPFGINTPAYFAVDNLRVLLVPEPATVVLVLTAALFAVPFGRRKRARGSCSSVRF